MLESLTYLPKALIQPRDKPFLIWAAPPVFTVSALLMLAFLVVAILSSGSGVADFGSQSAGEVDLSIILAMGLLLIAADLSAAYGLLKEREWARRLLTHWSLGGYVAIVGVLALTAFPLKSAVAESWGCLAWIGLCYWYFYRHASVVEYYARLAAHGRKRSV